MATSYLAIKLIHVLSATILFGTGIGTAFFLLAAYRSGNGQALSVTSHHVVTADWIFTAPAVVIQLISGLWLMRYLQFSMTSAWFAAVVTMFVLVGLCWLPVVWIQIQIRRLATDSAHAQKDARCLTLMRVWLTLGIIAFTLTLALFYMMIFKPGL